MEGRADRKDFGALGAALIRQFGASLHRGSTARNYNLFRRIEIGRLADLVLRSIATNLNDFIVVHSQDRSHGSDAYRDGFLHIFPAIADSLHRIHETQSSRRNMRRIFAQAMPSYEIGFQSAFMDNPPGRDRSRKNRRLSDLSKAQLLFR